MEAERPNENGRLTERAALLFEGGKRMGRRTDAAGKKNMRLKSGICKKGDGRQIPAVCVNAK